MASKNLVILIGRLGHTPVLRYTPEGAARCSTTLATNQRAIDPSGNKVEHTEWHNLVLHNTVAEQLCQASQKGSEIYVEGFLRTRQYESKRDKVTKKVTEIVVLKLNVIAHPAGAARAAA